MPRRTNLLAILSIVAVVIAQPFHHPEPDGELATQNAARMTVLGRDRIVVTGGDGVVLREIEAVVDRFDQADLPLSVGLIVDVHTSRDGCGGHRGPYGSGGDGQRVDLCEPHQRPSSATNWPMHGNDTTSTTRPAGCSWSYSG